MKHYLLIQATAIAALLSSCITAEKCNARFPVEREIQTWYKDTTVITHSTCFDTVVQFKRLDTLIIHDHQTDIKTELQILTLDPDTLGPNIRAHQRKFNQLAARYKQLDDWYMVEENKMDAIGEQFYKDNQEATDFVPNDAYKKAEARQKRWSEQSDKLDVKLKDLLQRGCIDNSEFDHLS